MSFISVAEYARRYDISERTVRNYCNQGKLDGAFLTGKTWNIPEDAVVTKGKQKVKESVLLKTLREQKSMRLKGSIYHKTQIDLTFNSNHMEGSKLTHEQTRHIFETNTIGVEDSSIRVDDIIETVNHFRCIDSIIDHATDKLTEAYIKELHKILKSGTQDSNMDWFHVGDYKMLPNEVGGQDTCAPEKVHKEMASLLKAYNSKKRKDLDDILDFHQRFESIHPFQDGNGRVGRLIMFKECLANGIVPFIITEELRRFYYRGLQQWQHIPEYLRDTCLTAQDNYKDYLNYFRIKF
ncbi:MAG: Fic family protein [Bacteroidaceae bacterium]|nr:Fic family protein [Bacteroidaceae bacterium]